MIFCCLKFLSWYLIVWSMVFDCVVMFNVDFFGNEKYWYEIIKRYFMYRIWFIFILLDVWFYVFWKCIGLKFYVVFLLL